ncbi:MAG: hypothetical protein KCHDKBKB_00764 [Elusimicrobia bacterium]|nr:hypothetical protein [Elusimicrobiota bacterium]
MRLFIGMPVYITNELHLDYTRQTIESIKTKHEYELMLIVTHCDPALRPELDKLGTTVDNPKGNILASAWNYAIQLGLEVGHDYIFLPNNDIVFHPQAIDNLVDFAQKHMDFLMVTSAEHIGLRTLNDQVLDNNWDEHPHFSCFMLNPVALEALREMEEGTPEPFPGRFDEGFVPAYFEDGDFHQRILRAGMIAAKTGSSWFYHYGSRTIKSDDDLNRKNASTYENNRRYFIKKWGFDPHGVVIGNDDPIRWTYSQPFGGENE